MTADIFDRDPMLLEEQNQREYGRELLRNILLRRTAKSGSAELVDLFAQTVPRVPLEAPSRRGVSEDLVERYIRSRIDRTKLSSEDFSALSEVTMVCRGEATERRRRGVMGRDGEMQSTFALHDAAAGELAARNVNLETRFRVAAVGMRVKVSTDVDPSPVGEDLCMLGPLPERQDIDGIPEDTGIFQLGRTAWPLEGAPAQWAKWVDTVCGHVRAATESGSEIIMLPEFALPPELEGEGVETRILGEIANKAVQQAPLLLFAGSRHDGAFNRGLMRYLRPGDAPHERKWHYKNASAKARGENILGPKSSDYETFPFEFDLGDRHLVLNATVAICYDAFDPSTFLSLVLRAAAWKDYEATQVILVPSFNPSTQFVDLLRDLSFLTGGIVIYVNSLHGDAKAFIAGFAASDFIEPSLSKTLKKLADYTDSLQKFVDDAPTVIADARRHKDTELIAVTVRQLAEYRKRLSVLERVQGRFERLKSAGGFDHLVTVERCPACEAGNHEDDYHCKTDILYYNFDPRLIEALSLWRVLYFAIDEGFIPEPYHRETIEREADRMMKNKDGRVAVG